MANIKTVKYAFPPSCEQNRERREVFVKINLDGLIPYFFIMLPGGPAHELLVVVKVQCCIGCMVNVFVCGEGWENQLYV